MQTEKNISSAEIPIIAVIVPSKAYNDLTPPIVECTLLLFVSLSAVTVLLGVSVLVLGSPKNINYFILFLN